MAQHIVRILNPVPGGARYTNIRQAKHYERIGRAALTSDNKELFFYTAATVLLRRETEREEAALKRYRGGVVLWNGSAKDNRNGPVLHGPGEVRS
jgi:hypothetical protein